MTARVSLRFLAPQMISIDDDDARFRDKIAADAFS